MDFVTIDWCTPLYQESLELRHQLLREPLGLGFTAEDLDGEHSDLHFGVTEGDDLLGIVVATKLEPENFKLRQMAIRLDHQGKGIGRQLLLYAETELQGRGCRIVQLHARETAMEFYERLGYEAVGEPFDEVTLPHRKMTKTLVTSQAANASTDQAP